MLFRDLTRFYLLLLGIPSGRVAVAAGGNVFGHPSGYNGCAECCSTLAKRFGDQVSYPGDAVYIAEQKYWSEQQSNTIPVCRFSPIDADGVSAAILEIRKTECQFAVKSGGHAAFKGGSNIQKGMTIDLRNLSSIKVSSDRTATQVGTGNRWEDVYSKLDPMKLAVIGGRNGDIGTGGLTLGGGISFFSGYHGWACDNVKTYEVVIANGSIVNANTKQNPDLYWALRGGGNNFGVVTTLDLETFDQGKLWGGATVYALTANRSIYEAYYWFNKNAATDPKGALIVASACVSGSGCFFSNNYEYTDPIANPPIFDNFTSIPNISSTERIATLLNLTEELKASQPDGFRQIFMTLTLQNDAQILSDILEIWYNDIQPIMNITDFLPALVFQPITKPIINNFKKNGGNALGITDADGELTIMDIDFQWGDIADDARVKSIMNSIISKTISLAKSRGLYNRYIYQNYAYIEQDVFAGYGEANKNRLIKISKEYDPEGVFQILQPGYFKLRS